MRAYWSGNGKWLVTTSGDGTVTIWDPTQERKPPPAPVGRQTLSGAGGTMRVAVAGDLLVEDTAKRLTIWEISTGKKVRELDQSEHAYGDWFLLTDDGKRLVALNTARQEINVWDVMTGKLVHSRVPEADRVIHQLVGLSSDGREAYAVLTGVKSGDTYRDLPTEGIHAIRLEDGHVELRVKHRIKFSGDTQPPITADRRVFLDDRAWDLRTGAEVGSYPWKHVDAVSPNGQFAATNDFDTGADWRVVIWDVPAKKKLGRLPQLACAIGTLAFSPDAKLLAVGGDRDWGSTRLPPERRQAPPPASTGFSPPVSMGKFNHVEDRVLLLYDVPTQKRVRMLAFPVYPTDSKETPDPEIP